MKKNTTKSLFEVFQGSEISNLRTIKGGAVITGPGGGVNKWTYDTYTTTGDTRMDGRGNDV